MQTRRDRAYISELNDRREVLISYLKMKVEECDWHGVSDAANDIRVLEAEISARTQFLDPV